MEPNRLRELLEGSSRLAEADSQLLCAALANDPDLLAEQERIEAWDAKLAPAMEDVVVPAGIAQRISAAVRSTTDVPAASSETVEPAVVPKRSRRALIFSLAAVVAASLLVALVANQQSAAHPTAEQIVQESLDLSRGLSEESWQADLANAPRENPFSTAVLVQPRHWQTLSTRLDPQAVAYGIRWRGLSTATLVVMRSSAEFDDLPGLPPARPQHNTEGRCVGAWQADGLVYVLVVNGSENEYRSLLRTPLPIT